jgi:hypothetical protein
MPLPYATSHKRINCSLQIADTVEGSLNLVHSVANRP